MAPLRTVTVRGMSQVITTTVIAVLILLLHLRVLLLVIAIVAKIAAIPMPAALCSVRDLGVSQRDLCCLHCLFGTPCSDIPNPHISFDDILRTLNPNATYPVGP